MFSFTDPDTAAQDQIVTALTQNLLRKHGFEGKDQGREGEDGIVWWELQLELVVFKFDGAQSKTTVVSINKE